MKLEEDKTDEIKRCRKKTMAGVEHLKAGTTWIESEEKSVMIHR